MHLDIEVDLFIHPKQDEIILHPRGQSHLRCDREGQITLRFRRLETDPESDIPLFRVEMREGLYQRITVEALRVSGAPVLDFEKFCLFQTRLNRYTTDEAQMTTELSYNGEFLIHPRADLQQWQWFPFHYSRRRGDLIMPNHPWDCDSDHHCDAVCVSLGEPHTNRWMNQAMRHQAQLFPDGSHHDWLAVGASHTHGTSIPRGEEFAARIPGSVVNLGCPGMGIDGVLVNLKEGLRRWSVDRIFVEIPTYGLRIWRFRQDGHEFQIPMGVNLYVNAGVWGTGGRNAHIWRSWQEVQSARNTMRKYVVDHKREQERRGQRCIDRILRILRSQSRPWYITSWSPRAYKYLKERVHPNQLLPEWPDDRSARDGRHSHPNTHRTYFERVFDQLYGYEE
jgi:hypothetical protein